MGHSMGGHGALTIAIKNPGVYSSVSAFAPICNPRESPWGKKAFAGYLGVDVGQWKEHDATELMVKRSFDDILIDVGDADNFYADGQLLPERFKAACDAAGQPCSLRIQPGYDHRLRALLRSQVTSPPTLVERQVTTPSEALFPRGSYFFISTFVAEHIAFHARRLSK